MDVVRCEERKKWRGRRAKRQLDTEGRVMADKNPTVRVVDNEPHPFFGTSSKFKSGRCWL